MASQIDSTTCYCKPENVALYLGITTAAAISGACYGVVFSKIHPLTSLSPFEAATINGAITAAFGGVLGASFLIDTRKMSEVAKTIISLAAAILAAAAFFLTPVLLGYNLSVFQIAHLSIMSLPATQVFSYATSAVFQSLMNKEKSFSND